MGIFKFYWSRRIKFLYNLCEFYYLESIVYEFYGKVLVILFIGEIFDFWGLSLVFVFNKLNDKKIDNWELILKEVKKI